MKISSTTPRETLSYLKTYYTKEKDSVSRELSELLVNNERKFDGEVYRPQLWNDYKFLTERYLECEQSLKNINYFLSKETVEFV